MAIYVFSFLITRKKHKKGKEVKPYMQAVATSEEDSYEEAAEYIRDMFPDTKRGKTGWELSGDPVLFEVHTDLFNQWLEYMDEKPAPPPKKPSHLQVVK